MVEVIIAKNIKHNFSWANPSNLLFPECWRSANVTAIPKGAPSPDKENYLPISITPILYKVYEKLVSHKLSSFCEKYVFLLAAQFSYRKGLGCTDAMLTIFHHGRKSLDTGMESNIVQQDFSAAFDREHHSDLLFKLKSLVVGGSVLSICRELLSNRRQRVVVDGTTSDWIPIVSGVPQGSVLGPRLSFFISEMFGLVENRLYAYADNSTLLAVVRKPADRPTVAASLNKDLAGIQEWCNQW